MCVCVCVCVCVCGLVIHQIFGNQNYSAKNSKKNSFGVQWNK